MKKIMALLAVIPALTLASVAVVGPGVASAAPSPTPNGLTGALNMVNADALLLGMPNAMSVNNVNGDVGMFCAVHITNGVTPPGDCR